MSIFMENNKVRRSDGKNAIAELASVPLGDLLSAPISACIGGFAESSNATLNFVSTFFSGNEDNGYEPAVVRFCFNDTESNSLKIIDVPLLTLVPIPYLVINEFDCEFTANVTDVRMSSAEQNGESWVSMKADVSRVKESSFEKGSRYDVLIAMDVNMVVVRGEVPEGVSKMLSHLESVATVTDA